MTIRLSKLFFLVILSCLQLSAQIVGRVVNAEGNPIAWAVVLVQTGKTIKAHGNTGEDGSAVVLVQTGKTIKAHGNTGEDGSFVLPQVEPPFVLSIRHLSYETLVLTDENYRDQKSAVFFLKIKENKLKEVTVSAPAIKQRGDTVRYQINRFSSSVDISLEDALKKLPGISVAKSGVVSYLGKSIDKLTIDSLDLTGKNYQVATRNISHDMVRSVEVIENQQEVKQLKGLVGGSQLVMNVTLKDQAKHKLNGNIEAGVGVEPMYVPHSSNATGMLFKPSLQILFSIGHNDGGSLKWMSSGISSGLAPAGPQYAAPERLDISDRNYLHRKDWFGSGNAIFKTSPYSTLRAIVGYEDHQDHFSYRKQITYYSKDKPIDIEESSTPYERKRIPSVSIRYICNSDKTFWDAEVRYMGNVLRGEHNIIRSGREIGQLLEQNYLLYRPRQRPLKRVEDVYLRSIHSRSTIFTLYREVYTANGYRISKEEAHSFHFRLIHLGLFLGIGE